MFPAHPEALNAAWLTMVLREAGTLTHTQVVAAQITILGGTKGAIGQIARLLLTYDNNESAAPQSLIAKFASTDPALRTLGNALGLYLREVSFYRELAAQVEVRTPYCYFAAINSQSGECLLLLEDLAPARNGDRVAGCNPSEALLVVQALATLHADWWMHPALARLDWLRPFDSAPLEAAYQQAWGPFTTKLATLLSPELLRLGEQLGANLATVFAGYWDEPWTLLHNDLQLDNLFFSADMQLTIIDWQSAVRGRGMLEVAGFLGGNLSIADRRAHEQPLLEAYYAILLKRGVRAYSFEQCYLDYRVSMFDGFSRMIIALASNLREEQERAHRDVLWPRYSTAVLDLNAGELLP